jgi:hypothetical protein
VSVLSSYFLFCCSNCWSLFRKSKLIKRQLIYYHQLDSIYFILTLSQLTFFTVTNKTIDKLKLDWRCRNEKWNSCLLTIEHLENGLFFFLSNILLARQKRKYIHWLVLPIAIVIKLLNRPGESFFIFKV